MNEKLRDAFVELHEQPLLEELRTCLALQYPGLDIPPVPARGNLDLNDVRDSEYFFN
jgi:DNA-directed RNA polymerase